MYVVEMQSGRWYWWIRRQERRFETMDAAWDWVGTVMNTRKWYRYRVVSPNGQSAMGGGNF